MENTSCRLEFNGYGWKPQNGLATVVEQQSILAKKLLHAVLLKLQHTFHNLQVYKRFPWLYT